jgi:hypothetical protein
VYRASFGVNDDDVQLVNYEPFGKDWAPRFMSRHPQLNSARMKLIEAARVKDVSVERFTRWFYDLERVITEYGIQPENIYNMDESGESEDEQDSIDESEASQDEELPILDCIEVRKQNH